MMSDLDEFIHSDSDEEYPKRYRFKYKKPRKYSTFNNNYECEKDCKLCILGSPFYLQPPYYSGWRDTLFAIFERFTPRKTFISWCEKMDEDPSNVCSALANQEWLCLHDTYYFIEKHFDLLCPPQHRFKQAFNWKKALQDALSHNKQFFENGSHLFGKTGFWRITNYGMQYIRERYNQHFSGLLLLAEAALVYE